MEQNLLTGRTKGFVSTVKEKIPDVLVTFLIAKNSVLCDVLSLANNLPVGQVNGGK